MSKSTDNRSSLQLSSDEQQEYTNVMRVVGGVGWASVMTIVIGVILILVPQVPRPWLWLIIPLWVGLSGLGVGLQWFVARGSCPKCGYEQSVPPTLKRCPNCRSYIKAIDRKIVKVG
ncbi:MAG: hypothetical protein HC940_10570 [Acaryochloris sp. SU_5_25]|nr:hypothetical protein [Acaryochloris sp. SU_5_25]